MAVLTAVVLALGWWCSGKIAEYKRMRRMMGEQPSKEGLAWALAVIRRFAQKYHPEGNSNLDTASFMVHRYLKHFENYQKEYNNGTDKDRNKDA